MRAVSRLRLPRRAFLKLALAGAALPLTALLGQREAAPRAYAAAGAPDPQGESGVPVEVIGPRSPFQPFEYVAPQQAGFPILGSQVYADGDLQIDLTFAATWDSTAPPNSNVGFQVIAGAEPNSPTRPGLLFNQRKLDGQLVLGHRHAGRVDATLLGPAPEGLAACRLFIPQDGMSVTVTTPNGQRTVQLAETLFTEGREVRIDASSGYAVERINAVSVAKLGGTASVAQTPDGGALRDLAAARGMSIGTIAEVWRPTYDTRYEALLRRHFNHVAVGGGLDWKNSRPNRDTFFFAWADAELNFATVNGLDAAAHHLIWHTLFGRNLPGWLSGGSFSRDEMLAIMREHIATVMEHYREKVSRWVVVNEAMSPNGFWPNDPWYRAIGPDYVELAFRAARDVDPAVELIYNDNNAVANKMADHVYALVKGLKDQGLIDGVGMQMHVRIKDAAGPSWQPVMPSKEELRGEMRRYADLGLSVEITELDVNVGGAPITQEEKLLRQAQAYADLLAVALESGVCRRFTMFGFVDSLSWLVRREDIKDTSEAPCIFDADYQPKPAYFAMQRVLAGG